MSWRTIVITKEAKLSLRLNHLVVKHENVIKVPLSEIAALILENPNVSISGHMLNALAKQHILTILCDEQHNPSVFIQSTFGHHRQPRKIKEQFSWTDRKKGLAWQNIVRQKITLQYSLINHYIHDERKHLLKGYIDQVQLHDGTNREGHAAKVYFNLLFGHQFTRDKEIPINWALNYGYSILCSSLTRLIVSKGYLSEIGIHHINEFNLYNLASDLMEVYRPLIDRIVYEMNLEGTLSEFNKHHRRVILSMFDKKVKINEKVYTLNHSMQLYLDGFFDFMSKDKTTEFCLPIY